MLHHIQEAGASSVIVPEARPARQKQNRIIRGASLALLAGILLWGVSLIQSVGGESSFTMIAYASGIEEPAVASGNIIEISENSSIELPFGRIERNSGPIETTDDEGNPVIRYNAGYTNLNSGNGTFSIQGEDILSVTYTSEQGMLDYWDDIMMKQDKNYIEAQQTAIRNNQKLVLIKSSDAYRQYSHKVTPKYYPELGDRSFAVSWVPIYAIDMLVEDGEISLVDLPHDRITIEVTLKNKVKVVKVMDLSFAADGGVIARML